MQEKFQSWLHWVPRILAIVGIFFLSIFAIDVFFAYEKISEMLVALFMHLIPSYILIAATVVAWRYRLTGGILFLVLSVVSVIFFNTYRHIATFLILTFPLFIVGWLFIWDGLNEGTTPPAEAQSMG